MGSEKGKFFFFFFCGFMGPGCMAMVLLIQLSLPVHLFVFWSVRSFVTLLEILISVFLDTALEVKGPKGLKNDRRQIFGKIHFLGKDA